MSQTVLFDPVRPKFAPFDAKEISALTELVTDDVRLRLGNAPMVQGRTAFVTAVNAFLGSVAVFRHEVLNLWSDRHTVIAELELHPA
jgi:hypothetical protein